MMKLQMRRKSKKRLPSRVKEPLVLPQAMNETWSMDFMCDTLESGRRFRILTAIDDFNREALIVKPQSIFPAEYVVNAIKTSFFIEENPVKFVLTTILSSYPRYLLTGAMRMTLRLNTFNRASQFKMHTSNDSIDYIGKMF